MTEKRNAVILVGQVDSPPRISQITKGALIMTSSHVKQLTMAELIKTKESLERSIAQYEADIKALNRIVKYRRVNRTYAMPLIYQIRKYIKEDEEDLQQVLHDIDAKQKSLF